MITALNIEEKKSRGVLSFLRLKTNKIRVEHLYCDKAAIKCITYEKYRKTVDWNAIDRFVKSQRNHLLCPADLELSEKGYRRFESFELSKRMCENAALYLLSEAKDKDLTVSLIDPSGEYVPIPRDLFDFCGRVTVVTDCEDLYLDEAARLLEEKGAVLCVSKSRDALLDADIIIAPDRIEEPLPVRPQAILFTSQSPLVEIGCCVIYKYFFDLPQKYESIRPVFLEPMYFAEAMYTLANAHELSDSVFRYCSDGVTVHTRKSLTEFLKTRI